MSFEFNVNVQDIVEERPLLPAGNYEGKISSASVTDKDGNSLIAIAQIQEWNKQTKAFEVPDKDAWELRGEISLMIALTDEEAKKILRQDEPKLFGRIPLKFNQETGNLDYSDHRNAPFKQIVELFGIDLNELMSAIDMSRVKAAEVPEEISHVKNVEDLVQAQEAWRQLCMLICHDLVEKPVTAVVDVKTNKNGTQNILSSGTYNAPFCGLMAP